MTLDAALNGSLSALLANQAILTTIANNIANANTEGYTKQSPVLVPQVTGNDVAGVTVGDVERVVDEILQGQIQQQNGDVGFEDKLSDFFEDILFLYGQPGSNNDLTANLNTFFDGITQAASDPSPIAKTLAVQSGVKLANFLSDLSNGVIDLQFEADNAISSTVKKINTLLSQLNTLNQSIGEAAAEAQAPNALLDQRDKLVTDLSTLINIKVSQKDDGRVEITTTNNGKEFILLATDVAGVQLSYTPAVSDSTFINGESLGAITVQFLNTSGSTIFSQNLLEAGVAGSASSTLKGELGALIQVRDDEIPELLGILDNFTDLLLEEFNALHNDGVSFPPPATLTGTTSVASTTDLNFTGEVLFAPMDNDGSPITSPFSNDAPQNNGEAALPAFTLPFTKLGSSATVADVVKAFNERYNEIEATAQVGTDTNSNPIISKFNLRGSSATDSDSDGNLNSISFNIDAMNANDQDVTIVVDSVAANPSAGVSITNNISTAETWQPGDWIWSDNTIDVTLPDSGASITFTVTITVTDAASNTYTSAVDFVIDTSQAATNVPGEIYAASAATSDGTIITPSPSSSIAEMSIVNSSGTAVSAGTSGFLQIAMANSTDGIGIDELTSTHTVPSGSSGTSTSRGFSHHFGLNNFFIEDSSTTKVSSAINLDVTQAIQDNPTLVALGQLTQSQQLDSAENPLYSFEIGAGNSLAAQSYVDLLLSSVAFSASGSLPAITTTFADYASNITELTALKTENSRLNKEQKDSLVNGLIARQEAISGVNVDEELAKSVLFQNAYTAAAKIISTIDELFATLLELGG